MQRLKDLIQSAGTVLAFTGAGVSTLSGIRDFRGRNGFYNSQWEGIEVEDILSIDLFDRDPATFYRWAREFVYCLDRYQPSAVHLVLSELERKGYLKGIYTQNIDMLHQKAGSGAVWELHGSPSRHYCRTCNRVYSYNDVAPTVLSGKLPFCSICGTVVKPSIVLYGETLDTQLVDQAYQDMAKADVLLVLGSSLTVQPAASLPMAAYYHGGKIVIINAQPTSMDRYAKLRYDDLQTVFDALLPWAIDLEPKV